ncbi:VanZ family protein [Isachenkonia alkalipeptolytica]|uniref:VanZ family protein n=1 Tax=Isachenkonia alkalipeptolytica TaxID=2565777 RepID=UPI00191C066B|nr:VanZ family protein [Isachenkonia alkalipeptolytica]
MKKKLSLVTIGKAWLPVLLWMGVIFYFSHQPGDVSGDASGRIVGAITSLLAAIIPFIEINEEMLHFLFRKGAHFGVYAVLGILSVRAFQISGYSGKRGLLYGWILATVYAGVDEYHQTFIPGRSGEVSDVLIDSVGAVTGIAMYWLAKGIRLPSAAGVNTLQYILLQEQQQEQKQEAQQMEEEEQQRNQEEQPKQQEQQRQEEKEEVFRGSRARAVQRLKEEGWEK